MPTRQTTPGAELQAELVEAGDRSPVEVEGVKGVRYILGDERRPAPPGGSGDGRGREQPGGVDPGVAFLAPLDPLVWDRDLLRRLHGFDYLWEVYVPAAKRKWGYYVLPILFGDRFVGRIEPRFERATGHVAHRRACGGRPASTRSMTRMPRASSGRSRTRWRRTGRSAG